MPPLPRTAFLLGFSGLAPAVLADAALLTGALDWRFVALAALYAYAALILSFLGGLWWGLAAARSDRASAWLWVASVVPTLVALATAVPWMIGAPWPAPSLLVLAVALLATLLVDRALVRRQLAPPNWMHLRAPLSIGLAALSALGAAL